MEKENPNLITVFICFLRSGLRFTRYDTNNVGLAFIDEIKKHNANFKPEKVQQRERDQIYTVNAYPKEFEQLILSLIEEYRIKHKLEYRLKKPRSGGGFNRGGGSRPGGGYNQNRDNRGGGSYGQRSSSANREGGYRPRRDDQGSSGYGQRRESDANRDGGYRPRRNHDDQQGQGGYRPRRDDQGSSGHRRENDGNRDGGYRPRRDSGINRDGSSPDRNSGSRDDSERNKRPRRPSE